ncbi:MAG: hypothetical protein NVSMB18_04950 [Acetobacteraceae bacterium]
MKPFHITCAAIAVLVSATLGQAAVAQTRLDHDVQKLWDDVVNPGPSGDERTNWERQRDAERRDWCRYNTGYDRCSTYR